MSQVWDCDYCKCVTRKPGPNCKNLNCSCHPAQNLQQQLEAAKLREADLDGSLNLVRADLDDARFDTAKWQRRHEHVVQERDAALSALVNLQTLTGTLIKWIQHTVPEWASEVEKYMDLCEQEIAKSPSAALAERDWAIEKRTAERCAEIVSGYIYSGCHALQAHIRRVFGLTKP